ncbi:E3 ubiquitin-protein ligase HERC, partial [Acrasis kona]
MQGFCEVYIEDEVNIQTIVCGSKHYVVLTDRGKAYSSGKNYSGQLMLGHNDEVLPGEFHPILLFYPNKIVQIDCGESHTMIVSAERRLFCCGSNQNGQLGTNSRVDVWVPTAVPFKKSIVQVSCGAHHTIILTSDFEVYSTGYNRFGQLGLGHSNTSRTFERINCLSDLSKTKNRIGRVLCGHAHSLFIVPDGSTIYVCGQNNGSYGLGYLNNLSIPQKICLHNTIGRSIKLVPNSLFFSTTVVSDDNRIYTTGRDLYHENERIRMLTRITEFTVMESDLLLHQNIVQIATGSDHAVILIKSLFEPKIKKLTHHCSFSD